MNRRSFLATIGVSPLVLAPAALMPARAVAGDASILDMWARPRQLWITRPESGESGKFTYWQDGQIVEEEYFRICRLMRDLKENKSVAMNIGLLNFQYAIQQGINYYFGPAPYILTDAHRTPRTNASIENASQKSKHLDAAANDGRYQKPTISDLFKLASWFGVGGVGIYPAHVHVDAGSLRRWAGGYGPKRKGSA